MEKQYNAEVYESVCSPRGKRWVGIGSYKVMAQSKKEAVAKAIELAKKDNKYLSEYRVSVIIK